MIIRFFANSEETGEHLIAIKCKIVVSSTELCHSNQEKIVVSAIVVSATKLYNNK